MSKYRFKTKEEFIRDGLWSENYPYLWNASGKMNNYLGQDIPEEFNDKCDKGVGFNYEGWIFSSNNYVLKETPVDMKAIQEEAKKRFPIGCSFKNTGGDGPFTLKKDDVVYEIRGTNIWAHNGCGCLYKDGKWAELISLPEPVSINEFKEGDYIVTLNVESGEWNCARNNYCFKQRVDNKGIYPVVDLGGSKTNGHDIMSFNKKKYLKDWRYATPEEIAEYDRIGKPYDVTTLQKKEEYIPQIGDYVVMEKAAGWGYSPDNNGCIAIVEKVSSKTVQHLGSVSYTVPSIYCTVVSPKNLNNINFIDVPIIGLDKERIFRKALPHEIPSNLPKKDVIKKSDSPLEICKQKYKKGMVVQSAQKSGMYSGIFTINANPEEFTITGGGVDYFRSKGFLYLKGKYAEILSYPDEQLKIEYPNSEDSVLNKIIIQKETFIGNVQSVDINLVVKKKRIIF